MRVYITPEEAMFLMPAGDGIHTFVQSGFGLIGADWSRKEIEEKLNESNATIELTGPKARAMGHGIAVYNSGAKNMGDVLFVETDENRLSELEEARGLVMEDDGHERVD